MLGPTAETPPTTSADQAEAAAPWRVVSPAAWRPARRPREAGRLGWMSERSRWTRVSLPRLELCWLRSGAPLELCWLRSGAPLAATAPSSAAPAWPRVPTSIPTPCGARRFDEELVPLPCWGALAVRGAAPWEA